MRVRVRVRLRVGGVLRVVLAIVVFVVLSMARVAPAAGPNLGLPVEAIAIDRATPRRTVEGFRQAARAGDFARAAHYLDLRGIEPKNQASDGALLAQHLAYVLEQNVVFDPAAIPDQPDAPPSPGAGGLLVVSSIYLDEAPVPISLVRARFDDGVQRWLFSRPTVTMVPSLYDEFGARSWEDRLPPSLVRLRFFGNMAWQWIGLSLAIVVAYLLARVSSAIVVGILRRLAKRSATPWDDALVEAGRRPLRVVFTVVALRSLTDLLHLTASSQMIADRIYRSVLVLGVVWFVVAAIGIGSQWVRERLPSGGEHDIKNRSIRTQLAVTRRLMQVLVVVVGLAIVLMQFDFVRSVGMSLLASAGIAGIVVGLAAQKSLAGVIAGIQLSITQPVRIGDTVVIENEQGTIEEINLTYVVVRVWDQRRLIIPIGRFLEQPFQNWTKSSAEILGTVTIPCDFATPVDRVREELRRICEAHAAWDKRECSLRVIESTDRCITLRALVSSIDAPKNWELRCDVRERLVRFLQELDGGVYLPRQREESVRATSARA